MYVRACFAVVYSIANALALISAQQQMDGETRLQTRAHTHIRRVSHYTRRRDAVAAIAYANAPKPRPESHKPRRQRMARLYLRSPLVCKCFWRTATTPDTRSGLKLKPRQRACAPAPSPLAPAADYIIYVSVPPPPSTPARAHCTICNDMSTVQIF